MSGLDLRTKRTKKLNRNLSKFKEGSRQDSLKVLSRSKIAKRNAPSGMVQMRAREPTFAKEKPSPELDKILFHLIFFFSKTCERKMEAITSQTQCPRHINELKL